MVKTINHFTGFLYPQKKIDTCTFNNNTNCYTLHRDRYLQYLSVFCFRFILLIETFKGKA